MAVITRETLLRHMTEIAKSTTYQDITVDVSWNGNDIVSSGAQFTLELAREACKAVTAIPLQAVPAVPLVILATAQTTKDNSKDMVRLAHDCAELSGVIIFHYYDTSTKEWKQNIPHNQDLVDKIFRFIELAYNIYINAVKLRKRRRFLRFMSAKVDVGTIAALRQTLDQAKAAFTLGIGLETHSEVYRIGAGGQPTSPTPVQAPPDNRIPTSLDNPASTMPPHQSASQSPTGSSNPASDPATPPLSPPSQTYPTRPGQSPSHDSVPTFTDSIPFVRPPPRPNNQPPPVSAISPGSSYPTETQPSSAQSLHTPPLEMRSDAGLHYGHNPPMRHSPPPSGQTPPTPHNIPQSHSGGTPYSPFPTPHNIPQSPPGGMPYSPFPTSQSSSIGAGAYVNVGGNYTAVNGGNYTNNTNSNNTYSSSSVNSGNTYNHNSHNFNGT